jgi:hypothetical protein
VAEVRNIKIKPQFVLPERTAESALGGHIITEETQEHEETRHTNTSQISSGLKVKDDLAGASRPRAATTGHSGMRRAHMRNKTVGQSSSFFDCPKPARAASKRIEQPPSARTMQIQ